MTNQMKKHIERLGLAGKLQPMTAETGETIYVGVVRVNRVLAALWLDKQVEGQRGIKINPKKKIIRSIVGDRFMYTGDTVKFLKNGKLGDGQHRLLGVIETGDPIDTLVAFGISKAAFAVIDQNARRSLPDVFRAHKDWGCNTTVLAPTINFLTRFDGFDFIGVMTSMTQDLTVHESIDYAESCDRIADSVNIGQWAYNHAGDAVSGSSSSINAAAHYLFAQIDREAADEFFTKLGSGENISGNLLLLRNTLASRIAKSDTGQMGSPAARWTIFALIVKTWSAIRMGKELKPRTLKFDHQKDPFPGIV